MEETSCSVATTPSPVPQSTTSVAATSTGADVFPSPPRTQQQQQQQPQPPPPPQQQQQQQQPQPQPIGHQAIAPPVRILGRNVNGTVVQTSMPQNEAELQLYRVMQRASLLSYYDTLLEMGGDDVQQLCDAGEEEFLEIMALVGMASKPLHVRRLQKALQEWLTNPAMFQTPVLAPPASGSGTSASKAAGAPIAPVAFPCIGSYSPNTRQQIQSSSSSMSSLAASSVSAAALGSIASQNAAAKLQQASSASSSSSSSSTSTLVPGLPLAPAAVTPPSGSGHTGAPAPLVQQPGARLLGQRLAAASSSSSSSSSFAAGCCPIQRRRSLSPQATTLPFGSVQMQSASTTADSSAAGLGVSVSATALPLSHSPGIVQVGNYESSSCGSQGTTPSPNGSSALIAAPQSPTMGLQGTPILLESQVQRLAEAAERLASTIRPLNPKPQSGIKKKMCKNLEMVMAMPDTDPRRMEEIRKYAAIYGRFDCKRKPEKPLTLHEVSVNEAAAQICRFVPALLTRRDELFPLARRVVRDSGHYYTKSLLHSSNTSPRTMSSRENGDGELSGGDEGSMTGSCSALTTTTTTTTTTNAASAGSDAAKRRKLELRCEDDSVAGNRDNPAESAQQQAEYIRSRSANYNRGAIAIDSDNSNSIQIHQNRHRKRQKRRRLSRIGHRPVSSPVWPSCTDGSTIVLDGVVEGLEDSDGCYSSFEDDWDNCNEDDCDNNFEVDTDEGAGDDDDEVSSTPASMMQDVQSRIPTEKDDSSCVIDKENDFNLKVIASCGDNIIAVANPALMNRNQPSSKEQPIKEEITLRDRRD